MEGGGRRGRGREGEDRRRGRGREGEGGGLREHCLTVSLHKEGTLPEKSPAWSWDQLPGWRGS